MAKKTYCGINNIALQIPNKGYGGSPNSKAWKLVKGYSGDENGKAQQFWGDDGFVIFADGIFDHTPNGVSLSNYIEAQDISDLVSSYRTNKILWIHESGYTTRWALVNNLIDSQYTDLTKQILNNLIYIPINRITSPDSLKIRTIGNLVSFVGRIENNVMVEGQRKYICSNIWKEALIDISSQSYIDYIMLGAPDKILATYNGFTPRYTTLPLYTVQNILHYRIETYNYPSMTTLTSVKDIYYTLTDCWAVTNVQSPNMIIPVYVFAKQEMSYFYQYTIYYPSSGNTLTGSGTEQINQTVTRNGITYYYQYIMPGTGYPGEIITLLLEKSTFTTSQDGLWEVAHILFSGEKNLLNSIDGSLQRISKIEVKGGTEQV